jgi:methylenetetrahydrofolate reductase (NADPH)
MRVTDLWTTKKQPTISFELFPARSIEAADKLEKVIDNLSAVKPDFVSVTFGAGGSTKEGSYQLVKKLKNEKGFKVVAYFACYGLGPDDITSVLNSYKELGIETILAVRGDAPKEMEGFQPHPESLPHASDLLAFLTKRYDFCLGGAGYPEGHIEAESKEKDLEFLKLKVKNGAQYIIANYTYDNRCFFDFVDKCRSLGIDVPILPGVMPIYSIKMMESLSNVCGAAITDEIRLGLAQLPPNDNQAVANFGIEFACRQCKELIENGVPGIHIYTMDRSKASVEIVTRLRKEGLI